MTISVLDFKKWAPKERRPWIGVEVGDLSEAIVNTYKGRTYSLFFIKNTSNQCIHTHPVAQHTILLEGKGKFVLQKKSMNIVHQLTIGKPLNIPADIPHVLIPETDILIFQWFEGDLEKNKREENKTQEIIPIKLDLKISKSIYKFIESYCLIANIKPDEFFYSAILHSLEELSNSLKCYQI